MTLLYYTILYYTIRCVQFSSVPQSWVTLYDPMDCIMPGLPVHPQLLELAQTPSSLSIKSVMPFNHLVLCCPLLLLPSIFASIRVFSSESVLHIRWPRYWSFSFSISPSNKYSALISFRIDWFDLLTVQGTLKSLLQLAPFSGLVLDLDSTPLLHLAQNDYMASWCPALC